MNTKQNSLKSHSLDTNCIKIVTVNWLTNTSKRNMYSLLIIYLTSYPTIVIFVNILITQSSLPMQCTGGCSFHLIFAMQFLSICHIEYCRVYVVIVWQVGTILIQMCRYIFTWNIFVRVWWTHCGRVTHICGIELTINGSDNDLSPGRSMCNISFHCLRRYSAQNTHQPTCKSRLNKVTEMV